MCYSTMHLLIYSTHSYLASSCAPFLWNLPPSL